MDPSEVTRTITVLDGGAAEVAVGLHGDHVVLAPADLESVLGWDLKPEGLCCGEVCVPVRDRSLVEPAGEGNGVSLQGVASLLDRPLVVDLEAGVAALGAPRADRRRALAGTAPSFTLPDLDGHVHDLEEWHDRKKVLVAFASW
jgi:hypothetical protein